MLSSNPVPQEHRNSNEHTLYLDNEVNAGDSWGGHHLGTVGNEVDQMR